MYGELIEIIYQFFSSVFFRDINDDIYSLSDVRYAFWNAFYHDNNNYSRLQRFGNEMAGYDGADIGTSIAALFAYISTIGVTIILIILLFRLFKWMFNLIFKLFRLN